MHRSYLEPHLRSPQIGQIAQRPGEISALAGTLIRWGPDLWAWSDHTLAPQVFDVRGVEVFRFKCRTYGQGDDAERLAFVEVADTDIQSNPDLTWVKLADYDRAPANAAQGDGTRVKDISITLVPLLDWLQWAENWCAGAQWKEQDSSSVMEKASALGKRIRPTAT